MPPKLPCAGAVCSCKCVEHDDETGESVSRDTISGQPLEALTESQRRPMVLIKLAKGLGAS